MVLSVGQVSSSLHISQNIRIFIIGITLDWNGHDLWNESNAISLLYTIRNLLYSSLFYRRISILDSDWCIEGFTPLLHGGGVYTPPPWWRVINVQASTLDVHSV